MDLVHNTAYVRGIQTVIMLKFRKVNFLQYKTNEREQRCQR